MKSLKIFMIVIIGLCLPWLGASKAHAIEVFIAPSLMDEKMDGWFKIPPNSGPRIHKTAKIYQGQEFNLLIFFRDYSPDANDNLNMSFDIQTYAPNGEKTDDAGLDFLGYKGPAIGSNALILAQEYPKITFTQKYELGEYNIKVTAHDNVSGDTHIVETPIELIPFRVPERFQSMEDFAKWSTSYHTDPEPIKAISALLYLMELDENLINQSLNLVTFFRTIFLNNPFLFQGIFENLGTFTLEEQKKLIFIAGVCNDELLKSKIDKKHEKELIQIYKMGKNIPIPDTNNQIDSALKLDILWSEFFATGEYEPIKKIVSALELQKYSGSVEKIQNKEVKITEESRQNAYLDATFQSAQWSLISNAKEHPLVHKYLAYIFQNETLNPQIKNELKKILLSLRTQSQ